MRKKIGIIGAADIAQKRFLPALSNIKEFEYFGVASHSAEKAEKIKSKFGGIVYDNYQKILDDDRVDAVYIALPPALHHEWALKAVLAKKHILVEKPFVVNYAQAKEIIDAAKKNDIAIHENFMYRYHSQYTSYFDLINSNVIGNVWEYKIRFGFPMRDECDFRYNQKLGGGALLDCGCYTLDLARRILGESIEVICSQIYYDKNIDVDIFGSVVLSSEKKCTVSTSFGMNNEYQCQIEAWGSKGILRADRFFTAPDSFKPCFKLIKNGIITIIEQNVDNHFFNSILYFGKCISNIEIRHANYQEIERQASLLDRIQMKAIKYKK